MKSSSRCLRLPTGLPSGLLEGVSQTDRQTYRAAAPDSVKVSSATENTHLFICPDSAFNS